MNTHGQKLNPLHLRAFFVTNPAAVIRLNWHESMDKQEFKTWFRNRLLAKIAGGQPQTRKRSDKWQTDLMRFGHRVKSRSLMHTSEIPKEYRQRFHYRTERN